MRRPISTTPADHWLMGGLLAQGINAITLVQRYAGIRYGKRHPVMKAAGKLCDAIAQLRVRMEDAAYEEHPEASSTLMYFRDGQLPQIQEDIREWWTERQAKHLCGISRDKLRSLASARQISSITTGDGPLYRPADILNHLPAE